MSWDQLKKAREQRGDSHFLSLKDGDKVVGAFRGQPYGYWRKFPDKTEWADWAEGRRFRFKTNLVVKDQDEWKAKIFEGSKTVSEQLLDVIEKYSQDCLFEIKRSGSTKDDTRYTIMLEKKLDKAELAELEKVTLKELTQGKSVKEDLPEVPEAEEEEMF